MLSDEAVTEFQELYKKEYGVEVPRDEAREMAQRLVNFVKAVYTPEDIKRVK